MSGEDMRKLREEFDTLAKEYFELKRDKTAVDELLVEEREKLKEEAKKIEELEQKLD